MYLVDNTIQIGVKTVLRYKNFSLDGYVTSVLIAQWLLERNISIMWALRKDRVGLPKEMTTDIGRSERCCYNENLMLVSYTDKKKKDINKVPLLRRSRSKSWFGANSRTLCNEITNKKLSDFQIIWYLEKELVMQFIQQRYQDNFGINSSLKEKLRWYWILFLSRTIFCLHKQKESMGTKNVLKRYIELVTKLQRKGLW